MPPIHVGFQVHNLTTYPNFLEILEFLGVADDYPNLFNAESDDSETAELESCLRPASGLC